MRAYSSPHAEILKIGDMREVVEFFWDFRSQWKFIGLELGIDMGTLDSIERTQRMVVEDSYLEMLKHWLKRATLTPTRSAMAAVLQSRPLAGVSTTAGELLRKFHQHL